MDFFHCGRCGHWPLFQSENRARYFLTSCGKLMCENCLIAIKQKCTCGSEQCKFMALKPQNENRDLKMFFMEPISLLQDSLRKPMQAMQFQSALQKNSLRIVGKLLESHKAMKNENNTLKLEYAHLRERNEKLKARFDELSHSQQASPRPAHSQAVVSPFRSEALGAGQHNNSRPFAISSRPPSNFATPSPSFGTPASTVSQLGSGQSSLPSPYFRNGFSSGSGSGSGSATTPAFISRLRSLNCRISPHNPMIPRS